MVVLAGLAFAIRVRNLGASDLTFDECASAFNSAKPYGEMIKYLTAEAFHELPPAYYVMLRAWRFLAGQGEFALRYPSVIFGLLGIALIYRLGRRGLGAGVGIIAASLFAFQPFQFYYSQDARPYTLMTVEAMLMVYFFDRLCHDSRLRWWVAFGVTGTVAVLTHYFMGYMVAALCVYLLLHARAHRQVALVWFGGLAAVGVVMLTWLIASRAGRLVRRVLLGTTLQGFVDRLAPGQAMLADVVFGPVQRLNLQWLTLIATLIVIGLLVSILRCRWRTLAPGGAWLLPAWLLVPTLLLILVPERLEARYNAAIVPAYCLVLALAVTWLWQSRYMRLLVPVALGAILYVQVVTLIPTMNLIKSDYGHVVAYLNRHARPGDSLIFNGDWQWVQQLYYPAQASLPRYNLPPMTPPGLVPDQARPELEKALATSKRIWVLPAAVGETDPKRFVAGWLNEHAYPTSEYHELSLYYVGASTAAPARLSPPVTWDNALQLESVRWTLDQAAPGEPLLLDLNWLVLRAPGRDVRIWIGLADRDGGVWYTTQIAPGLYYAPSSAWQSGQRVTTRVGIPVPFGTPPGEFGVRVNVAGSRPNTGGDYASLTGAQVLPCSQTNPCPPLLSEDLMPLRAAFGDGLTLAGYQVGGTEFTQGRFAAITFYWQPERRLSNDVTERLALVDQSGRVVAQTEGPPVAGWYPSSQWMPGQLLADPQVILIPAKLAPGEYWFRVGLIAPDGLTVGRELDVARIHIRARDRQFRAGAITHSLKVEFGDKVRLLGYDVQVKSADRQVTLALYWQAMRETDENYTVFTHIIGPDGRQAGQKDSWPQDGDYPTSFWMRGEVVRDEYVIPFEGGAGAYRVEVGLYDAVTLTRLPAVSDGARLANDAVIVPLSVEH